MFSNINIFQNLFNEPNNISNSFANSVFNWTRVAMILKLNDLIERSQLVSSSFDERTRFKKVKLIWKRAVQRERKQSVYSMHREKQREVIKSNLKRIVEKTKRRRGGVRSKRPSAITRESDREDRRCCASWAAKVGRRALFRSPAAAWNALVW